MEIHVTCRNCYWDCVQCGFCTSKMDMVTQIHIQTRLERSFFEFSFFLPVSHVTGFVFSSKLTVIFHGKSIISQCNNTVGPWWNSRVATLWRQYSMEVSLELSHTQLKYLQVVNFWFWILRTVTSTRSQAKCLDVSFLCWNCLSLIMFFIQIAILFWLFMVAILISSNARRM